MTDFSTQSIPTVRSAFSPPETHTSIRPLILSLVQKIGPVPLAELEVTVRRTWEALLPSEAIESAVKSMMDVGYIDVDDKLNVSANDVTGVIATELPIDIPSSESVSPNHADNPTGLIAST